MTTASPQVQQGRRLIPPVPGTAMHNGKFGSAMAAQSGTVTAVNCAV